MKLYLLISFVWVLATAEVFGGANWFSSKAAYNKWHETELERWLSDHEIPYPTPADRRDLENLVKSNWQSKVQQPIGSVADYAVDQGHHSKEWIFDTWSDSHLKAFLDAHGVPVPQPPRRNVLLRAARESLESIARRIGDTIAYPGNWVYAQWSESDLRAWLEERGWPVPEPTNRDKLIASVRRNSRLASLQAQSLASSVSSSADAAQSTLSDAVFTAWSDSQLKLFLDEHGVRVPQGSRRNELIALARKHRASLLSDASSATKAAASTISDAYGAATSRAGNEYAKATDDAKLIGYDAFDKAVAVWSDSRLKAYLDARGIPVPQGGRRDELLSKVRANKYKAARNWNVWTFDTWDAENLKKYLSSISASDVANRADATREELMRQAQDAYAKASKAGGTNYASATSKMAQATGTARDVTFDRWSRSEIKSYLDSFGIPVYQGSNLNELRAAARRNAYYFKYGTTTPQSTVYASIMDTAQWVLDQLKLGALIGQGKGHDAAEHTRQRAESLRSEL